MSKPIRRSGESLIYNLRKCKSKNPAPAWLSAAKSRESAAASADNLKHSCSDFDIFLFMAVVKEVIVYVVHESALAHLGEASAAMEAFLATRAGFPRGPP
jgi:hypothetical protein